MRNSFSFIFVIFSITFFASCQEEVLDTSHDYIKMVKEVELENEITYNKMMYDFYGDNEYFFAKNPVLDKSFNKHTIGEYGDKVQKVEGIVGPIATTMPQSIVLSNYRMYLPSQPGLAAGIYFCDIYAYSKQITLPSNAVTGFVNSINPEGFSNYINQTVGYTFSITSSNGSNIFVLSALTYKIHVKTSIIGASVNKILPTSLTNVNSVTLNYSYVTP